MSAKARSDWSDRRSNTSSSLPASMKVVNEGIVMSDPLALELEIDAVRKPLESVAVTLPTAQLLLRERVEDYDFAGST